MEDEEGVEEAAGIVEDGEVMFVVAVDDGDETVVDGDETVVDGDISVEGGGVIVVDGDI